jgi:carbamoyl-phosphate synthase large subunit
LTQYCHDMQVFFTNSEIEGAGYYMNSRDFYSLKVKRSFMVPIARNLDYLPALRSICAQEKIDLIYGGTEHEIFRLSELKNEPGFEDKVVALPLNIVEITTDKWLTAQFFERRSLPAPRSCLYSNIKDWLPKVSFPLLMKPRVSSASRNIFVVNSLEEMEDRRFDHPEAIVVQEYIGTTEDEYTVGCYLDKIDLRFHCIVMKRKLSKDGASISGQVVKDEKVERYCAKIMAALEQEGLVWGPANVQLRYHQGEPLCFEINGRFSSTEAPRAALGFNAVEASITNLIEKKPYTAFKPETGARFLRYYEEVYFDNSDINAIQKV